MKKSNFDSNDLIIDVFDYTFTEWLVRRNLYRRFVSNLPAVKNNSASARTAVRKLISCVVNSSYSTLPDVVSLAFNFQSSPEGSIFWINVSREWRLFVRSLPHLI